MTGTRQRSLGYLVSLLLVFPPPSYACYCDRKPFQALAKNADIVVIGRVVDQATKQFETKEDESFGEKYWISHVKISRVLRGKVQVGDLLPVGGGWTSCDTGPTTVRVGGEYALALTRHKMFGRFYWLNLCQESSIPIKADGRKQGASKEEIEQWARPAKK